MRRKSCNALLFSPQCEVGYAEECQYVYSEPLSAILNGDEYQGYLYYGCQYIVIICV